MRSSGSSLSVLRSTKHSYFGGIGGSKKRDRTEGWTYPDKAAVPHQGLWFMKCPSTSPITSIVELNSSPFCQHTRNILSGCCRRDLLINGIRAAPCHDKIDKLLLETGVNRECPLWIHQSILGICWVLLVVKSG